MEEGEVGCEVAVCVCQAPRVGRPRRRETGRDQRWRAAFGFESGTLGLSDLSRSSLLSGIYMCRGSLEKFASGQMGHAKLSSCDRRASEAQTD